MEKNRTLPNLDWMRTEERNPAKEVLKQMYGTDDGIGAYAEEDKQAALQDCHSLQDAIGIVIRYAETLNWEQQDYADVSPRGGLDISVVSVDEIAFRQLGDLTPFADPDQDVVLELAKALKGAGHPLELFERQTRLYETIQSLPDSLLDLFANTKELEQEIEQIKRKQLDFSLQYLEPIEDRLADLQEEEQQIERYSPLRKLWNRGRLQNLEQERERLKLEKSSLQERFDGMRKNVEGKCEELFEATFDLETFYYPWEDEERDAPHTIRTEEDLEKTIQEIRRYGEQSEIQEAYQCAAQILEAVQQPEPLSFAEERERRKQASFPEKENRRGISSELGRDRDDFTRSR